MKQPSLFVIAGANGAGKSTLSQLFVPPGTDIFDGDKEMLKLKAMYSAIDSGTLYDSVNGVIFSERKQRAITSGKDFAFETNFRTSEVMDTVKEFKSNGYQVNLIFLGLKNVEASLNRVNIRVQSGGHFVDAENVNKNYAGGIENLVSFYDRFDFVDVMESSVAHDSPFEINSLLAIKEGRIVAQAEILPEWVMGIPKAIAVKQAQKIRAQLEKEKLSLKEEQQSKEKGRNRGMGLGPVNRTGIFLMLNECKHQPETYGKKRRQ